MPQQVRRGHVREIQKIKDLRKVKYIISILGFTFCIMMSSVISNEKFVEGSQVANAFRSMCTYIKSSEQPAMRLPCNLRS
ncbi:hypothetical protein PUN28_000264 [Cardiocondyla obscurior]|uniref:Uncharacterized protein n=1 Tax=Cardiocondyla obscurior TaxID=286306 RepID=A0AAW2GYU4_9HYME